MLNRGDMVHAEIEVAHGECQLRRGHRRRCSAPLVCRPTAAERDSQRYDIEGLLPSLRWAST
jgi:hypothetical protein